MLKREKRKVQDVTSQIAQLHNQNPSTYSSSPSPTALQAEESEKCDTSIDYTHTHQLITRKRGRALKRPLKTSANRLRDHRVNDWPSGLSITAITFLVRDVRGLALWLVNHCHDVPLPELSVGQQAAFEVFLRDHEDRLTIEDNRAVLQQRSVCATFTFTFMHLADAFIQSDLHCIILYICIYVCAIPGIEPMTLALLVPRSNH
ncbi:hypothetical protein DPX16_8608 [Anabarilius grahami]|uniref:Uncharacterized protein n=1 Tax=Anabarilius grahami TaxID=495550 RepID=A0A3N0Y9D9_ANAGA|nr:hypothetical protein DPX16_8608 [Anabarilius grahami]